MEDETLELHFKHGREANQALADSLKSGLHDIRTDHKALAETTQATFLEVSKRQGEAEVRLNVIESDVETVKANPFIKIGIGAGAVGGTGLIGAIVWYFQQQGAPIP